MPIYEYQCQDCAHKLEVMQRISDGLLKTCPSCGKDALKKLVSAVGFQLKGTGWYETDFKGKSKAKRDDGDGGGSSSTSTSTSSDSASTESKPKSTVSADD